MWKTSLPRDSCGLGHSSGYLCSACNAHLLVHFCRSTPELTINPHSPKTTAEPPQHQPRNTRNNPRTTQNLPTTTQNHPTTTQNHLRPLLIKTLHCRKSYRLSACLLVCLSDCIVSAAPLAIVYLFLLCFVLFCVISVLPFRFFSSLV